MARCYSRDLKQDDPFGKKLSKIESSDADSDSDMEYVPHFVIRSGNNNENGAGSSKNADDIDEEKKMSEIDDSESDEDFKPLLDVMSGNVNQNGASSSKYADNINEGASTSKLPELQKLLSKEDDPSLRQNHPVLSLKCLHEDTDDEGSLSKMDEDESSKFIDVNDVPELPLNDKDELQVSDVVHAENESEEHPNLEPVVKESPTMILIPVVNLSQQMPVIPLRTKHEGVHNFRIKIHCSTVPKSNQCPVFSKSRNKLYVCKDVPFIVYINAENVPQGSMISVQAVFSRPEHMSEPVTRCPTHVQQDYVKGLPACEHFVQCINDQAIYEKNLKDSRMSVSVPYVEPQDGQSFSSYLFKLTCFNSCVGGINRRPFSLVFTLEKNKVVLGRQMIEAKVCACPARDSKNEDGKPHFFKRRPQNVEPQTQVSLEDVASKSTVNIQPRPASSSQHLGQSQSTGPGKQKYTITVRDQESFEFLKHMKILYEMNVQPL